MKTRRIIKIVKDTFIVLTIVFLLLELSLMVIETKFKAISGRNLDIYSDNLEASGLQTLKPNLYLSASVENRKVIIKTNDNGFAWKNIKKVKNNNKKRIALIGDSFTMGLWADSLELSFANVFNELLLNNHIDSFEVLNFGVSGYGFYDYELILKKIIKEYEIDYIMICSFAGNDIRDTERGLLKKKAENNKNSENSKPTLLQKFRTYNFAINILNKLKVEELKKSNPFIDSMDNSMINSTYVRWSKKVYEKEMKMGVDSSIIIFNRMVTECLNHKITPIFVNIPYYEQVYSLKNKTKDFDIYYPQKYYQNFCNNNGIYYFDLTDSLRKEANEKKQRYYCIWDPHFNNEGHKVAGENIYKWFEEKIIK